MTTNILHANVERTRFGQHVTSALATLLPAAAHLVLKLIRPEAPSTKAESASVEAQRVRNLARSYAKTDPGFAADLYAAAARHEDLYAD